MQGGRTWGLSVCADSDYANATDGRSVLEGGVYGQAAVTWFSRNQRCVCVCVTLSTPEGEYVSMGDYVKEALFVRGAHHSS